MGKVFDGIDERLARWIADQQLFFVGTAPRRDGHVNVSPKGPIESLLVIDPHTVAYLDLIGSGAETIAHLRDNGRICLMLCAFAGPPRILRLHGRGEVLEPGDDGHADLLDRFRGAPIPGADDASRSIIRIAVDRIADSCGFDVPLMILQGRRPQREAWVAKKIADGESALADYVAEHNAASIDGLPAIARSQA